MMNEKQTASDYEKQAQKAVESLEFEVRRLVSEAAAGGEYEVVNRLTKLAQQVSAIKDAVGGGIVRREQLFDYSAPVRVEPKLTRSPSSKSKKKRKPTRPPGYPRFEADGNSLVKTSWSKSKKSEYLHKAPKRVLDKLVETLLSMGADEKVVATDELFPLSIGENQVPDYQSYLCLLWLKKTGLVNHHGREGYQIENPGTFKIDSEQRWEALLAS